MLAPLRGASCKAGFIDSMAGAASMMLKANWLENVQPLREKVVEMIALSEGIHAVAVGGPRWAMSSGGVATK